MQQQIFCLVAVKASKMAVVFGGCGRECLSGPGNTALYSQFGLQAPGNQL
jgi:hypothetical protein